MTKFIEVTVVDGKRQLLNTSDISRVLETLDHKAQVEFRGIDKSVIINCHDLFEDLVRLLEAKI